MKRGAIFGVLVAMVVAQGARAAPACSVPDDLALRDLDLPAAKQQVVAERRLVVVVKGGAFTAGGAAGDPAATYPAQLRAELAAQMAGVAVTVVNGATPGAMVEDVVQTMTAQIAAAQAKLVIWAPGGHDAIRRPNADAFLDYVEAGIRAVRHEGADLILMDLQYVPILEQWSRIDEFRRALRSTAAANDIPLFPRHELMRAWNDEGALNLDATEPAAQAQMTRTLFACVAKALATPISEAVR